MSRINRKILGTRQSPTNVNNRMQILIALTYYRPHYSGLTIYAEREARALVARGHKVTVLTSRFDPSLPAEEIQHGVRIIRPRVWFHISKGVIMPGMLLQAWRLLRQADIVHLHVPQLDAAGIAILARIMGKPVVLTYHCDLQLPRGVVNRVANLVSTLANHITAQLSQTIVQNTLDYAEHSPFLKKYLHKLKPLFPPVLLEPASVADLEAFRKRFQILPNERIIGMAARLATEKGVEILAQALPEVIKTYPTARVLFVGPYQNVFGEEAYAVRLEPLIKSLGDRWTFLGILSPVEMTAFFKTCEVTILPSLNSTESYGLVQVESMLCGTPVIASNLPGIRIPVQETGCGLTFPVGDSQALAKALIRVLSNTQEFQGQPEKLIQMSAPEQVATEYEKIFTHLCGVTTEKLIQPAGDNQTGS